MTTSEESDDSPRMVQLLEHFSLEAAYSWQITEGPILEFYLVALLPTHTFSKRGDVKYILKTTISASNKTFLVSILMSCILYLRKDRFKL